MLKIIEILDRVASVIKKTENQDIADALHVKPATCSNWKKRNKIPWDQLYEFTENNHLSMDWLLTGKTKSSQCPIACDKDMQDICERVKKVMSAKDGFSRALEANVYAFEESVDLKREVENLKKITSVGQDGGT